MINYLYQFLQIMSTFLNKIFQLRVYEDADIYLNFGFVLLYFAFAGILVNFIFGITSSYGVKGAISAGSDFVKNRKKK